MDPSTSVSRQPTILDPGAQPRGTETSPAAGLLASCKALRDPLVHNDYYRALTHVQSIEAAALELGFRELAFAASQTLQELDMWEEQLPQYQYTVNLYERAEWIHLELRAALGESGLQRALESYRHDFTPQRSGLYNINMREWDKARIRLGVGDFRRELREMSFDLGELMRTLPETKVREGAQSVLQTGHNLLRGCYRLPGLLKEAESRARVNTNLKPLIDPLERQVLEVMQSARALDHSQRDPRAKLTFENQVPGQLQILTNTLDNFEVEARVAFSGALGSSIPASAHRQVTIREHAGPPSESLLKAVQDMMSEWVIDRSLLQPQYGFGRAHTLDELRDYLVNHGGRLFRLQAGGQDVGYYILFPDSRDFPRDVLPMIQAVGKTGEFVDFIKLGWTQLVGVTKAGRDWGRTNNVDLYTIIHEAVVDTLSSFVVEKTFCIVRDGEFANLALNSHLRRGWRKTGATIQLGAFPYQILRFDVSPGSNHS